MNEHGRVTQTHTQGRRWADFACTARLFTQRHQVLQGTYFATSKNNGPAMQGTRAHNQRIVTRDRNLAQGGGEDEGG